MKRNVVAVIQARMSSTRLPGKMLRKLHGHPLADWVVKRVKSASLLDGVVVATSNDASDDVLAEYLVSQGVEVYRGSLEDVLGRMYEAARLAGATHVVRICGDDPLVSGIEVDNLVRFFLDSDCDYAFNNVPRGMNLYPRGMGAEISSFALFEEMAQIAKEPSQREHCFNYVWDNPERFRIATFDPPDKRMRHPHLKMDVDTPEDYERLASLPLNLHIHPAEAVQLCLQKEKDHAS